METTATPVSFMLGSIPSTDPTYKEWKLRKALGQDPHLPPPHGSYLQGMETLITDGEEKMRMGDARILPTRNGNFGFLSLILYPPQRRTDPTYKEWKPMKSIPEV